MHNMSSKEYSLLSEEIVAEDRNIFSVYRSFHHTVPSFHKLRAVHNMTSSGW